jgi:DNA (cytosine-5)-methyltransferase 1
MQEGNLPKAPIWDDIRTLPTNELPTVDIVYGGFPCQDVSIAGTQRGLEGKRSSLVFEIFRIAEAVRPAFIFLENVPNIRTKGAERVCKELAERGYDSRWCCLSASDVGARHKRERWWLLAYSNSSRSKSSESGGDREKKDETIAIRKDNYASWISCGTSAIWLSNKVNMANSDSARFQETRSEKQTDSTKQSMSLANSKCERSWRNGVDGRLYPKQETIQSENRETYTNDTKPSSKILANSMHEGCDDAVKQVHGLQSIKGGEAISNSERSGLYKGHEYQAGQASRYSWLEQSYWTVEPDVGRVVTGLSHRVDRIKALGNSVVPLCAREAFKRLVYGWR